MCEIMEKYMAEAAREADITAVANMLMLGNDEQKVRELYPEQFEAGKKLFFERMFDTRLTESELADLSTLRNLAPGDFRTVRQKTFYLDAAQTNTDRIAALREECLLKRDGEQRTSIGFAA